MNRVEREKTLNGILHIPDLKLKLAFEGMLVGLFAGTMITVLRLCLGFVMENRRTAVLFLRSLPPVYIIFWVAGLILLAGFIAGLVRWVPVAGGSGIPQIRSIVLGLEKSRHWMRVLLVKLLATATGIGAGLSMGREGPSVQIGGMAGQGVGRFLDNTNLETRALISSGAGAGIAAAFNAPLAGVLFTMEIIHKNMSALVMVPTLMASTTATLLVHNVFGHETVLAIPKMEIMPVNYLPQLVGLGILTGLAGVAFNKGTFAMGKFYQLPIFKNSWMRIGFALLLTIPVTYLLPQILGAGDNLIEAMVDLEGSLPLILVYLVGKFVFTLCSTASGAPGGSLQPMLVLGSLCGGLYGGTLAQLGMLPENFRLHMVVFGMAGLFTGSVRGPVTSVLLLLEMTGRFYHLVPLCIVVIFAYAAAEICEDTPIFDAMLEKSLKAKASNPNLMAAPREQHLLEVAVEGGSYAEGKTLAQIHFPGNALVISVRRGDMELIPRGNTLLLAGDYVYLLPNHGKLSELHKIFRCKTG